MDLNYIDKQRKLQKVSWNKLAKDLPINGDSLRIAFSRGSVDEVYIEKIIEFLKLEDKPSNTNRLSEPSTNYKSKETNAIWVNFEGYMLIPLVGKRAQAGFLSGWGDDEYLDELPKIPWEVDKNYKGKYMSFEVSGDSMDDGNPRTAILERDILLTREIQRQHWTNPLHINKWNFVIVHREDGILVKKIVKHDVERGILTLHSLNPFYEDFDVYMDDIIAIF